MNDFTTEIDGAPEEYEDTKSNTGIDGAPPTDVHDENTQNTPDTTNEDVHTEVSNEVNYEAIIAEDLTRLRAEFPELRDIKDITELENPLRYAALRDLGLDAAEAYLATTKRRRQDNRSHLRSAYGRSASAPSGMMTQRELSVARELFGNLSDAEIQRLYRKVTT